MSTISLTSCHSQLVPRPRTQAHRVTVRILYGYSSVRSCTSYEGLPPPRHPSGVVIGVDLVECLEQLSSSLLPCCCRFETTRSRQIGSRWRQRRALGSLDRNGCGRGFASLVSALLDVLVEFIQGGMGLARVGGSREPLSVDRSPHSIPRTRLPVCLATEVSAAGSWVPR